MSQNDPSDDAKALIAEAYTRLMDLIEPLLEAQFQADGYPASLFHYTDFGGMQGILETGSIRATYSRTLNDASEQTFGEKTVRNFLSRLQKESIACLREEVLGELSLTRNFVSCFCKSSDVLSMWVTYGSRGGGYCLEFEGIGGLLSCQYPPFRSMPFNITYGGDVPKNVASMLESAAAFGEQGSIEAIVASGWIQLMALRFKHAAFRHEEEMRLIIPNPPISHMKFRAGHANVKPYVELRPSFPDGSRRLPLKRIITGPTLRQDRILTETVEMLLKRYGYDEVIVEGCGIPFQP